MELRGIAVRAMVYLAVLNLALPILKPYFPNPKRDAARFAGSWYNLGSETPESTYASPRLVVSGEIENTGTASATPKCFLYYGSQIARVRSPAVTLVPGEAYVMAGVAPFHRPLDDYESGGFECYGVVPARIERARLEDLRPLMLLGPLRKVR
jgi:hypothetical protein